MLVLSCYWLCSLLTQGIPADDTATHRQSIEPEWVHLRSGALREWSSFPEEAAGQRLERTFSSIINSTECALLLKQQDVKQVWHVKLNGQKLGELTIDENDMLVAFAIPPGCLNSANNTLVIEPTETSVKNTDDIRVGEVSVVDRSVSQLLNESTLDIEVVDAESKQLLPCRITILDSRGSLQMLGTRSNKTLAVRPGTVFTADGRAKVSLPSGRYTVLAGRGFEYSLDRCEIETNAGASVRQRLTIAREVPTQGYVACDTHVHTLTHSGHGDATIEERMITLAGEGIELPISTDHNKHIDYEPTAQRVGVRSAFTPVMGNEVTTPRGHFNIFPVAAGSRVVDPKQTDWRLLMAEIRQTPNVAVIVLNHARDLHSGVRPFGPENHLAPVGENIHGWPLSFNAMEIFNSSATQSEPLRLFYDWLSLLNRGLKITPVGSSDSHDVLRHFVGQGRTYVRCDDEDIGQIDTQAAIDNFVAGRVMVSYGLLAELTVNKEYREGDLVPGPLAGEVRVDARVLAPHWVEANKIQLLANGVVIREESIDQNDKTARPPGVKWSGTWNIAGLDHDVHLVLLATGRGVDAPYWRTAKPYQPLSPDWEAITFGCSGAIWLDVDNDGQPTPARQYAERLVESVREDWPALITELSKYDEVVATHAAYLIHRSGILLESEALVAALKTAEPATQAGFQVYREAVRLHHLASPQR